MNKTWYCSLTAAVGLAASIAAGSTMAQEKPADFPNRPINLVVMYPAGGGMDVVARTFAQLAEQKTGTTFRVENRVGGGGIVGHTSLAKDTAADGYTIGVVGTPFLYTDILMRNAPFTVEEFEPIAQINFDPVVIAVNANSPLAEQSFEEILETAGSQRLSVGVNPDSVFQFVMEFIQTSAGVEFNFIPFDGGRQGVVALLAGDIDVTTGFYAEMSQYFDNGDLKPIAISGDERHPLMPDVATLTELGVPVEGQGWGATRYITVTPGTPDDRIAWLEAQFIEILQSPEAEAAFSESGMLLLPGDAERAARNYTQSYDTLRSFLIESGRVSE